MIGKLLGHTQVQTTRSARLAAGPVKAPVEAAAEQVLSTIANAVLGERKGCNRQVMRRYAIDEHNSFRSSADRRTWAAATFSSRCVSEDVPGMGAVTGEWASSQAIAT
jgi:hypothetical protein